MSQRPSTVNQGHREEARVRRGITGSNQLIADVINAARAGESVQDAYNAYRTANSQNQGNQGNQGNQNEGSITHPPADPSEEVAF